MANFPKLKTEAVAQYPAGKGVAFRNQTVRFVDGREQRYRDSAGMLRRWVIRLDRLDESEAAEFELFFQESQGRLRSFPFTDPWDGTQYPDCSLAVDEMEVLWLGEMQGRTTLTVIENRG
jgi:hypothetical protein